MSFKERRYIEAIPRQLFYEMVSDFAASLPADSHHKPTARTVKGVALQLADRQKYSPLHHQDCVNTTLEQLADYCVLEPSSISDALRCLEYLGIVKTIQKGGGIGKKPTVRYVNLSAFTQWGIPPFELNKESKQMPEHNGEIGKHNGENSKHIGGTNKQHGQSPQTLNELLNKDTESICTTNENRSEQSFDTDPYTALANAPIETNKEAIENEICDEQKFAMEQVKQMKNRYRYKD